MNALLPQSNSIKITPVNNGFILNLPKPNRSAFGDMMPDIQKMMGGIVSGMEKDALIAELEAKNISAARDEEEPLYDLCPDEYTHVFGSLEECLTFISKTYIKS